jgi:hypothetical protein
MKRRIKVNKTPKTLHICVHCAALPICRLYTNPVEALTKCPKIKALNSMKHIDHVSKAFEPFTIPSEYSAEIRVRLNYLKRIKEFRTVMHAEFAAVDFISIVN